MFIFRNSDGFATTQDGERHAGFSRPLKFDYHEFWEDFIAATSGTPAGFTHSTVGSTPTVAIGANSTLVQTLAGADNDTSALYATTASMTIAAGKKAYFRARLKIDKSASGTIGEQEVFVGLSSAQTTTSFMAADGLSMAVDNCVGFVSYDGTANICCVSRVSDVESVEANAASYAQATYMELAWDWDGSTIKFYKDTNLVATITTTPSTTAMVPMLYFKAGEAQPAVMTTDYIWCAIER
jgi:hypothetical protein